MNVSISVMESIYNNQAPTKNPSICQTEVKQHLLKYLNICINIIHLFMLSFFVYMYIQNIKKEERTSRKEDCKICRYLE